MLYHLGQRGIEWDLLPWLRAARIPVMAYSPIEQGRLLRTRALVDSRGAGMTPAQVALAWLLAKDDVIAIPKTGKRERVRENAGASRAPYAGRSCTSSTACFRRPRDRVGWR